MVRYTEQTLLLPLNRKPCLGFRLAYLHMTMAQSNGQGHSCAHFYCNYLVIGEGRETLQLQYGFKYFLSNDLVRSRRPLTSFQADLPRLARPPQCRQYYGLLPSIISIATKLFVNLKSELLMLKIFKLNY